LTEQLIYTRSDTACTNERSHRFNCHPHAYLLN